MNRSYKVVDVFTAKAFLGNPVAVVFDAEDLSDAEMQSIARWTNLSETTFLLPPTRQEADYRLRIFTPLRELPFAGHPTLGSAHAALEEGLVQANDGRLVQECGSGLVEITAQGDAPDRRLMLTLPDATVTPLADGDVTELEAILGAPVLPRPVPASIDVGPVWVVAQLADAAAVIGLQPDLALSAQFERRLGVTGITVFGMHSGGPADIEVRSFAPSCGVDEDPVCGSGNGSVAAARARAGQFPAGGASYVAAQGGSVGRAGLVEVRVDADGGVRLGGACVTTVDGRLVYRPEAVNFPGLR